MADIIIKNVTKKYGEKVVLESFNAILKQNKVSCIMGRSGCGKTTLLRLISKLERNYQGEITGVSANIAMVFQEDRLLNEFSPVKNIQFVSPKLKTQAIHENLRQVGLNEQSFNQPCIELSGGMKRRVAIVRAVMANCNLLILDEPFKGLDLKTKELVVNYIKNNTQNKTVILVTHDEQDVALMNANVINM